MDKQFLVLATLAAAAFPAAADQYDQPYSIIATEYKRAADPLERKLIMNRVDDVNSRNNEFVVAPGPHKVTVDLPPRKGFSQGTQVTFDLDTKACTRYFVVAKLKTQVTQDWEPVVKYEEPILECKKKFKV